MSLTFATWVADLSARGHSVLAASHAVPIQLENERPRICAASRFGDRRGASSGPSALRRCLSLEALKIRDFPAARAIDLRGGARYIPALPAGGEFPDVGTARPKRLDPRTSNAAPDSGCQISWCMTAGA